MNTNSLIVFLPFKSSTTKDLCGNSWTETGNPIIKNGKLFLDGSSYLTCDQQWLFAGQDFSIGCRFSATSNTSGGVLCLWQMYIGSSNRFHVSITTNGLLHLWKDSDSTINIKTSGSVLDGQEHYTLVVYSSGTWYLFLDGQLVGSKAHTFDGGTYTLYLGRNVYGDRKFTGYIDEFMFFYTTALHTENFTPPTDDELFAAEVELAGYAERFIDADTCTIIKNAPLLNSAAKVWLTADNYPTEDICGNYWHAYGALTSNGAIQFTDINQWLALDGGITLGGKDFTIRGKFNMSSTSGSYAKPFNIFQTANSDASMIALTRADTSTTQMRIVWAGSNATFNCTTNAVHDFEVSYSFADKIFRCFVDGSLVATKTYTLNQTSFANCWLGRSNYAGDGSFIGSIDNFQIIDGFALHTQDFIPMTVADIDAFKADFNARYSIGFSIQNQIDNEPLTWRYENAGFASLLVSSGKTLINLPATQSNTSVAFYQTTRAKCFDLPATPDIWIKFDVYFDGSNRWRAYNGGSNVAAGITAWNSSNPSPNALAFFDRDGRQLKYVTGVCKTNTLQTVLLHMVSDSSAGVIEAWVDGTKIYTYTGDVNHGEDFADIYLQSDGAGTFFSNVIVSNGELTFDDNLSFGTVNVEKICDVEYKARNYDENYCIAYRGKISSYSLIPAGVLPDNTEFTVEVEFSTLDTSTTASSFNQATIIGKDIVPSEKGTIYICVNGGKFRVQGVGSTKSWYLVDSNVFVADNLRHKISVRSNADTSLDIFIDGELVVHEDDVNAIIRSKLGVAYNLVNNGSAMAMLCYGIRFWDKALADDELFADIDGTEENLRAWYLPTPDGLADFSLNMFQPTNYTCYFGKYQATLHDVEVKIQNDNLIWRYDDSVIYHGTGLPIKFHLPATYDLWARFDATFDGVNYWYAFSGEVDDMTGAIAASDSDIDYIADNVPVQTLLNVLAKHRAQSFLLHLFSGEVDGKIELWIANVKQDIFTGNVNGGEPFTDFNLLCSGGTFFSNIIIANVSLEPEEIIRNITQFTSYNTATHYFYLNKGGSYPYSITYSVKNSVKHITEIDVTNINEIWAKFDATSDGVNRWWFYNDDGFGQNGITAQIDGSADFIADDETVQTQTDAITLNQTQSYIVHMISDTENGLIELRVKNGGTYTYTGNVNDGEAFDEIWLLSESRQVVFGNYILSTSPLDFDADIDIDVDGEPLTKIFFNVRHNGEVIKIPFVTDVSSNAVVIRWLKQNWYNPLTSSGDISLRLGSVTQALTSEL